MGPSSEWSYRAVIPAIALTILATLSVIFRCVSRLGVLHSFGADDVLIVGSWVFSIAFMIAIGFELHYGLGRHKHALNEEQKVGLSKAFYATIPVYNLSLTFTKISILLLYRRIFIGTYIKQAYRILLAIVVVYGLWTFWGTIFTCFPIRKFWDPTVTGGYCMNLKVQWFSNAAINIATDLMIFVCPIPVLKILHLPRCQKFSLIAIFAIGLFVCVTSVFRLYPLYRMTISHDQSKDNVSATAWSSAEVNVAIICACLPTLKPLIIRIYTRLLGSTRRTANSNTIHGEKTFDDRNAHALPFVKASHGRTDAGNEAIAPAAFVQHKREIGGDSLKTSVYEFDDFVYLSGGRASKARNGAGVIVRDRSPMCVKGTAEDTGSVVDGRIKVVTRISQEVEPRRGESETSEAGMKSDTSSERCLWEGTDLENKGS